MIRWRMLDAVFADRVDKKVMRGAARMNYRVTSVFQSSISSEDLSGHFSLPALTTRLESRKAWAL